MNILPTMIIWGDFALLQFIGLGEWYDPRLMNSLAAWVHHRPSPRGLTLIPFLLASPLTSINYFLLMSLLDQDVSVSGRCSPYNLMFWVKQLYQSVYKERNLLKRKIGDWEGGFGPSCFPVQLYIRLNFALVSFFMRLPLRLLKKILFHLSIPLQP